MLVPVLGTFFNIISTSTGTRARIKNNRDKRGTKVPVRSKIYGHAKFSTIEVGTRDLVNPGRSHTAVSVPGTTCIIVPRYWY